MNCICVGGLQDRLCKVHGTYGPVTRIDHEHVVADLRNQIAQLRERVRRLEQHTGLARPPVEGEGIYVIRSRRGLLSVCTPTAVRWTANDAEALHFNTKEEAEAMRNNIGCERGKSRVGLRGRTHCKHGQPHGRCADCDPDHTIADGSTTYKGPMV